MIDLTQKQRDLYDYIKQYQSDNGYPPTLREMATHHGVNIKTISDRLRALKMKGYAEYRPKVARGLKLIER